MDNLDKKNAKLEKLVKELKQKLEKKYNIFNKTKKI